MRVSGCDSESFTQPLRDLKFDRRGNYLLLVDLPLVVGAELEDLVDVEGGSGHGIGSIGRGSGGGRLVCPIAVVQYLCSYPLKRN